MNAKRKKAIEHEIKSYEAHIGHTITRRADGSTYVIAAVVLIGDNVMLRKEGHRFATVYADSLIYGHECSCGEGKTK